MKRQLHDSDEVFISPQQGWEQMQLLLDRKLPVKNKIPARKLYFPMMVAASLVTVFFMSTLVLNNTGIINLPNKQFIIADADKQDADKTSVKQGGVIANLKNATDLEKINDRIIKKDRISAAVGSSESNNLTFTKIEPAENIQHLTYLPINSLPGENVIAKLATIAVPPDTANNDFVELTEKPGKLHRQRTWNLSAGLAMNIMIGHQQNFIPYPAVELRYNLSKKYFLSLGLTAGSHVSGESRGIKKQTYVNDMVNNIQFYNTVNQYYDISYADIPLLAGVKISKKFSLVAGVQASVLLKTKTKTIIEQYDFQMRMAGEGINGVVNGTAVAPGSETNYRVEAKKMDYRITSGIKYNIHKLAFGLIYQHSLQPVLTGDLTSRNKHQLVMLNMQFNIK